MRVDLARLPEEVRRFCIAVSVCYMLTLPGVWSLIEECKAAYERVLAYPLPASPQAWPPPMPTMDDRIRVVLGLCLSTLKAEGYECACWGEQPCATCLAQRLLADLSAPASPQAKED